MQISRIALLVGLVFYFGLTALSSNDKGQQMARITDNTIVDTYPVISIDVQIGPRSEQTAGNKLTAQDLTVCENGVPQILASVQSGLIKAVSILFVFDTDIPLTRRHVLQKEIAGLQASLGTFLKSGDTVGVMALSDTATLLQDYINDGLSIKAAFYRVSQMVGRPVLPMERRIRIGMEEGIRIQRRSTNTEARRAIVFVSDSLEAAHQVIFANWFLRDAIDAPTIFCWRNLRDQAPDDRKLDSLSGSVTLAQLVPITGGEFVKEWDLLLSDLRTRTQVSYFTNTLGRSGELVKVSLLLRSGSAAEREKLQLIYPQVTMIPYSTR